MRHNLSLLAALFVAASAPAAGEKWERLNEQAAPFIVALAQDKQGNVWVGTEDKGVFRYNPSADETLRWWNFTARDALGDDNAYAIACDKLGRIWVGTLNHGVSVFSGDKWKNYDVLDGPIGERIFAIATCPTDGDVWMATSAGLTRYSLKDDSWTHYTREDGLPADLATSLAFDKAGNLFVGTECDGIAVGKAADEYKKWSHVKGPAHSAAQPIAPSGNGLPSAQINALLAASDGTVYAGTTAGLATSRDGGKTWTHVRGRDYAAKVRGRLGGAPAGWQDPPAAAAARLLPEDYVTALSEDDKAMIWVGFRQHGLGVLHPKTSRLVFLADKKGGTPDEYVAALLPAAAGRAFVGTYGAGLARSVEAYKTDAAKRKREIMEEKVPKLPSVAARPGLAELRAILKVLQNIPDRESKSILIEPMTDDWKSQGTWIDRYGTYAAVLCAMAGGGRDVPIGNGGPFGWRGSIGRNCSKGDQLRHWIHWPTTDNPRSLQNPIFGGRKQSEQDDHGEVYPMSKDGPHVYDTFYLPKGSTSSPSTSSTRTAMKA